MHQAAPDVLRVWAESPLRVVRLGVREYKIVGECIMFDMLPGLMQHYFDSNESEEKDPFRLVTKNREIVMQGENACMLPDVKWAIVHRLNNVESRSLTVAELCDPDLGEAVWGKDSVPQTQSIRNYVSEVNSTFAKFGIVATLRFSEKTGAFTLQLPTTDTEEPPHESDTEAQSALDKQPKAKKTAKRKDDTQGNSTPGR